MPVRSPRIKPTRASTSEEENACYNCDSPVNASMMKASIEGRARKISNRIEGKEPCSWFEIHYLAREIAKKTGGKKYDCVLGIANGGLVPAKLLAEELHMDEIQLIPVRNKQVVVPEMPHLDKKKKYLVIDDIYDTGATYQKVARALKGYRCDYAFCMSRYEQDAGICGRILNHNRWIVFPWEVSSEPN